MSLSRNRSITMNSIVSPPFLRIYRDKADVVLRRPFPEQGEHSSCACHWANYWHGIRLQTIPGDRDYSLLCSAVPGFVPGNLRAVDQTGPVQLIFPSKG